MRKTAALSLLGILLSAETAEREGNLRIDNFVDFGGEIGITGGEEAYVVNAKGGREGFVGVEDMPLGWDGWPIGEGPAAYSFLDGMRLIINIRPDGSLTDVDFKISYQGTLNEQVGNHLEFEFPSWSIGDFGEDIEITLQKYDPNNPNRIYPIHNIRDVIANHNGIIPLDPLPAGTYSAEDPYAHFNLRFVPEPATFGLIGAGLAAVLARRKKKEEREISTRRKYRYNGKK